MSQYLSKNDLLELTFLLIKLRMKRLGNVGEEEFDRS